MTNDLCAKQELKNSKSIQFQHRYQLMINTTHIENKGLTTSAVDIVTPYLLLPENDIY